MQKPDWDKIDTVLLDMDGTLIDKRHEDDFWGEDVPKAYAKKKGISLETAKQIAYKKYHAIEGTYDWSDVGHWEKEFGVKLWGIKKESVMKMRLHPHTLRFLKFLKKNKKKVYLVTASMPRDLKMKLKHLKMTEYFDKIYTQFDINETKTTKQFWIKLQKVNGYDNDRTLLAEDTEAVTNAAKLAGIRWFIYKSLYSSKKPPVTPKGFFCVRHFDEVISLKV